MTFPKSLLAALVVGSVALPAFAYDRGVAQRIHETVTGQMDQHFFVTKPCKVEAVKVLEMLAAGEDIVLLDIRTPEERSVVSLSHPAAVSIPMDELFKPENLDRLPQNGKIIVLCHSGNRASGTTALLKAAGFEDVSYVNGGMISLVTNLTPGTAPSL